MKTQREKKPRRSIFDPEYAPYGRFTDGKYGTPEQWAQSFRERMSDHEIEEILGEDNPYFILGIKPGATQAEVKTAFFKMAMKTHPDKHPEKDGSEFRRVRAAYEKLVL